MTETISQNTKSFNKSGALSITPCLARAERAFGARQVVHEHDAAGEEDDNASEDTCTGEQKRVAVQASHSPAVHVLRLLLVEEQTSVCGKRRLLQVRVRVREAAGVQPSDSRVRLYRHPM